MKYRFRKYKKTYKELLRELLFDIHLAIYKRLKNGVVYVGSREGDCDSIAEAYTKVRKGGYVFLR